jgi:hypothetical protein
MRNINEDLAIVREAFAAEGEFDGKHVVVPNDFFLRLEAKLNPPGPTIFDLIKDACEDSKACEALDAIESDMRDSEEILYVDIHGKEFVVAEKDA